MASHQAIVFDVQRFSIHDGPGIRTVVFFKGCSLACAWCQNPEAKQASPELAYYEEHCLPGCTRCLGVCPEQALGPDRAKRVDFARCTACGKCVEVCPGKALRSIGRSWTALELLGSVLRDRTFYQTSGGGITLSGGEPVLHASFLREFLPLAQGEGLHVAVETCGAYPFALLAPLLPYLDLVLFDVKAADPLRHYRYTGQDNRQILQNLGQLVRREVPVEVRMAVIPGWNSDAQNVAATARVLRELGVVRLRLLPYNHLWEAKLPRLGTARAPLRILPPEEGVYAALQDAFAQHGVFAQV
jgi:pyruvate formate lyase activating enzyme